MKLPQLSLPQVSLRELLLLLLVVSSPSLVVAEEKDFTSMTGEELVAALASTNRVPDVGTPRREVSKPPVGYDRKAQDRVYAAWNELLSRDESALPALIAGFKDKRYSATEDTGPLLRNLTVGSVCRWILADKLDANKRFTRQPGFPSYVYDVVDKNPKRWLDDHQDKSFADLQKESYAWFLGQDLPKRNGEEIRGLVKRALEELKESNEAYEPSPHKPVGRF